MVNVTSIYNVNASIRRLNAHNFGHPWLHIIDDIDLFGRKLYNGVALYPRHANALLYKGVPDFVAVGIGPFEQNSNYVAQGEPAAHLTGELRLLLVHRSRMPVAKSLSFSSMTLLKRTRARSQKILKHIAETCSQRRITKQFFLRRHQWQSRS